MRVKRFVTLVVLICVFLSSSLFSTISKGEANLTDIDGHWAKSEIQRLVDLGAISGYPDKRFKPDEPITRAAFLTVLTKALQIKTGYYNYFEDTYESWAKNYISAAYDSALIEMADFKTPELDDQTIVNFLPNQNITREEMARIIVRALGEAHAIIDVGSVMFTDGNVIDKNIIDYVAVASEKGIITGYPNGKFMPKSNATRAQTCVMINRILDYYKKPIALQKMDGEEIYSNFQDATVKIISYGRDGKEVGSGSGFVVDEHGSVMTNFHVIAGASSIKIEFANGSQKNVIGVYNYDKHLDVAILNIEAGNYKSIELGNSRILSYGEKIFTLGYPLGQNISISDGLISSRINDMEGHHFLQISAPISPGSSGGPLINQYGQVVGITTGTYIDGQNMNIAIPLSQMMKLYLNGDNDINVEVACSEEAGKTYDDLTISRTFFDIYGSPVKDGKLVNEDTIFTEKENQFLAIKFYCEHELYQKNNVLDGLLKVEDSHGNLVMFEFFPIHLGEGSATEVIHYLNKDVITLGEGKYTIELMIDYEAVESEEFYILPKDNFSQYKGTNLTMKSFDYTDYVQNDRDSRVPDDKFDIRETHGVGFSIQGDFEIPDISDFEYYGKRLLFELKITSDTGFEDTYYTMGTINSYTGKMDYWTFYGENEFIPGNYTGTLFYNEQAIAETGFKFTEGLGQNFVVKKTNIQFLTDQEEQLEKPKLNGHQSVVIPVTLEYMKNKISYLPDMVVRTEEDLVLDSTYFFPYQYYQYYNQEDSGKTVDLILEYEFTDKCEDLIKEGHQLTADIYLNGKILLSVDVDSTILSTEN